MIDRIRLTAAARSQLISLKRFTGIEHYNVLCRHALCLSLARPTVPPKEDYNFANGLDMDLRTLTGGNENLYLNLVRFRAIKDGIDLDEQSVRDYLIRHIHRGLSYLSNLKDKNSPEFIANKISNMY
ncbi:MAG: DNA sulfur modification protein DndE [Leptospirillum sp.]|jgi:DNA sulfur modification protein DndE